ncbi:isochorismatase family cysteine hydrolase [Bacillaceae bacterium]
MDRCLLVIDYTYDFVAEDGKLTCGAPARQIENRITELVRAFVREKQYVVFAIDVHEENDPYHPETKLFPPHNIRGTEGRKLYGRLGELVYSEWGGQLDQSESRQGLDHLYWMDKTRYSAFAGTDLELRLRARGIEEVHLTGVCTDICVLHTAVDAYNRGFRIVVHKDAVQSFNPAGHEWALQHFKNCLGATIMEKGAAM